MYNLLQSTMSAAGPPPTGGEGEDAAPVPVKTYKLNIHTAQFCGEELVIRSEDFPDVRPGDVLEFYHEEESFARLLLQVPCVSGWGKEWLDNILVSGHPGHTLPGEQIVQSCS